MIGDLFTKHGSDKDTYHSYGAVYDKILSPIRESARRVLEIGVLGGASLRAWKEYFPHALVVGVDNDDRVSVPAEDRILFVRCDAADADAVACALPEAEHPSFDLIVDDGSHWEGHQLKGWEIFGPRLAPGGVYVIEDVQCVESWKKFEDLGFQIVDMRSARRGWQFDNVLAVFGAKNPLEASDFV